ncbi:hypothetical protein LTR85_011800 [Meristemomyces frigidus]|nr:hypothetical protein LTR85_011800 [Meristemomyces frigidus]
MHFTNKSLITALATTTVFLQTAANPVAIPDPSPTIEQRSETSHPCAGDASGKTIGVQTCAKVTFKEFHNIAFDLSVTDTKGDSHPVYGWLRVYGPNNYHTDLPSAKVKNNLGHGHTVTVNGLTWDQGVGKITGVRAEGCVNDAFSDTCASSGFVKNPYA